MLWVKQHLQQYIYTLLTVTVKTRTTIYMIKQDKESFQSASSSSSTS